MEVAGEQENHRVQAGTVVWSFRGLLSSLPGRRRTTPRNRNLVREMLQRRDSLESGLEQGPTSAQSGGQALSLAPAHPYPSILPPISSPILLHSRDRVARKKTQWWLS